MAFVGNFGMDDGLGQMTNVGPDLWEITIDPWAYYGLAPGTSINGLFIVFRNADGTQTGKDDLDNDIFLDLSGPTPLLDLVASPENGLGTESMQFSGLPEKPPPQLQ